ncbi:MAG: hypothetical protein M1812_003112 [Candelaria pacifica]|nr:MAG: hypothetical protein M1812_003112 [Candelaria pacifica]
MPRGAPGHTITVPSTAVAGSTVAQFLSNESGLDGPKLSAINGAVFDWWYFDVVSYDLKSSITLTFFTDTAAGFPFSIEPSKDVTTVAISGTYPNGTLFAKQLNAAQAIITTIKDGSSGLWTGNDSSGWTGTPDLSRYVVKINAPAAGITGSFSLKSIAPAHYPCGPAKAGETMEVAPHIGWSNAVPDAEAYVDVVVDGEAFCFSGAGYHDKNWGDQPFFDSVSSWFWGHGRLGPYSIVWFDFLAPNGSEYRSAYASRNGKVLNTSCEAQSITVRPFGGNSTYPSTQSSGLPQGFEIVMDIGNEGILKANVTARFVTLAAASLYTRWIGNLEGSVNGGQLLKGLAQYEEFKIAV